MESKSENLFEENKMRTLTGKYIDPFNATLDNIDIVDIAIGLARQPRWGGHSVQFYSVARHSIEVANWLPPKLKLAGLLHDASEAYIGDIPKPIKDRLPDYKALEEKLMGVIFSKFGMEYPYSEAVKEMDLLQLKFEWENIVLKNKVDVYGETRDINDFMIYFNRLYNS